MQSARSAPCLCCGLNVLRVFMQSLMRASLVLCVVCCVLFVVSCVLCVVCCVLCIVCCVVCALSCVLCVVCCVLRVVCCVLCVVCCGLCVVCLCDVCCVLCVVDSICYDPYAMTCDDFLYVFRKSSHLHETHLEEF
jgi:hypothetical protein